MGCSCSFCENDDSDRNASQGISQFSTLELELVADCNLLHLHLDADKSVAPCGRLTLAKRMPTFWLVVAWVNSSSVLVNDTLESEADSSTLGMMQRLLPSLEIKQT